MNKTISNIIFILIILLPLAGYADNDHTGGTIGGLIPAPKVIEGQIENGIYTSPENEFSIDVPNWNEKSEYRYMQIKEQFSNAGQYLSFGPAAQNRNIYRIEFTRKLSKESYDIELESVKDQIFDSYIAQIENAYGSKTKLISERRGTYNSKNSFSRVYKQHTQEKKKLFSADVAEDLRYQAIDIVDYGSYVALFWVEIPLKDAKPSLEIESALMDNSYSEHVSFVKSFRLLKPNQTLNSTPKSGAN